MIQVHRTESSDWFSNAYLLVNPSLRQGILVDGNGVSEPILQRIEQEQIDITAILLTHHHQDHVDIAAYDPFDSAVIAHPDTAALAGLTAPAQGIVDGEVLRSAGMRIEALHTPGHATDHLAFLIENTHCFTADILFRGTVGGTRGPGGSDLVDLRRSIDRVLALPPSTTLHPGHRARPSPKSSPPTPSSPRGSAQRR